MICAQLQAEVMKRGLNFDIIGAGSSTSVVASACAYSGGGPSSYNMGGNAENLLGQEWVTPAGEVIRTGSLSSGCGWFCSEGPGPSSRGVTRGNLGSRGGLGTFTKCAIKLSHWPGPTEHGGRRAGLRDTVCRSHENFRVYTIGAPDWDAWANCYHEIYDNGIGYIFHKQFGLAGANLATGVVADLHRPDQDPERRRDARPRTRRSSEGHRGGAHLVPIRSWRAIRPMTSSCRTRSWTPSWPSTGCYKVKRYCEQDMAEFTNMYMQRLGHKHCNYHVGGRLHGKLDAGGAPRISSRDMLRLRSKGFDRDQESHLLVECGGDALMGPGSALPGGGQTALEQFVSYDSADDASIKACIKHMEDAIVDCVAQGLRSARKYMYLQIGWTTRRSSTAWRRCRNSSSSISSARSRKRLILTNLGDRNYQWLPESGEKRRRRRRRNKRTLATERSPALFVTRRSSPLAVDAAKATTGGAIRRADSRRDDQQCADRGFRTASGRQDLGHEERAMFNDYFLPGDAVPDPISGERPKKLKYCVGGHWKESESQQVHALLRPLDRRRDCLAPQCTAAEVEEAIQAAAKAFPAWRDTPVTKRVQVLFKMKQLLDSISTN